MLDGVCLLDVDAEEPNFVLEFLIDLIETPGLFAEWRSGIAAEHQCNGLAQHGRQPKHFAAARAVAR